MTPQQKALQDCITALEEACGNRCNAEYNPCYAREAITQAKQALEPQAQNAACEVLATVLHFIPASETDLLRDVSALCHDLRTHGKPQAQGEAKADCLCGRYEFCPTCKPGLFETTHPQASEPAGCTWTQQDDEHMPGTWASSCGELWSFIDGGPKDNRVSYCHHCGGKVNIPAAPEATK